jgi:hypothetical protein
MAVLELELARQQAFSTQAASFTKASYSNLLRVGEPQSEWAFRNGSTLSQSRQITSLVASRKLTAYISASTKHVPDYSPIADHTPAKAGMSKTRWVIVTATPDETPKTCRLPISALPMPM